MEKKVGEGKVSKKKKKEYLRGKNEWGPEWDAQHLLEVYQAKPITKRPLAVYKIKNLMCIIK